MRNSILLFTALPFLLLMGCESPGEEPPNDPQEERREDQKEPNTADSIFGTEPYNDYVEVIVGDRTKPVRGDTIRVYFQTKELITSGADSVKRKYLNSLGIKPKKVCHCNPELELWDVPVALNPSGVIEDPPPGDQGDGFMTVNFYVPRQIIGDTIIIENIDSTMSSIPASNRLGKTVIIGVVDTGIDIFPNSTSLDRFLWDGPEVLCNPIPSRDYGLDMISWGIPKDQKGHGSHVSGIVAGLGKGPFDIDISLGEVRLEVVSAKITEDCQNKMNLFDATCGIHYVLKQGAKVVNLSWGYLEKHDPTLPDSMKYRNHVPYIMEDALQEAKDSNAIIVAAIGNQAQDLNGDIKFWPACFSESWGNVISVQATIDGSGPALDRSYTNIHDASYRAPGTDIVSTIPFALKRWEEPLGTLRTLSTNGRGKASGTSMAAPYMTRTFAYMYGKREPDSTSQFKDWLEKPPQNAKDIYDPVGWISRW